MSPAPALPLSVPPAMSRAIRRALDPEPSGRPSLIELRRELATAANAVAAEMPASPRGMTAMPEPAAPGDGPAASGDTLFARLRRGRRRRLAIAIGAAVLTAAVVIGAALLAGRGDGGTATGSTPPVVAPANTGAATSMASPSTAPPTPPAATDRSRAGPVATLAPRSSVAVTAPPVTAAPTTTVAPTTAPPTSATAGALVPPTTVTAAPTGPSAPAATKPSAGGQTLVTESQAGAFIRSYYDAVAAGDYDESWSELAPEFQRGKARSFEYYVDFWNDNDIAVGTVHLVDADEEQAIVNVELRWNGSSTGGVDQFTLRPDEHGRLLIAGQTSLDGG